MKMSREIKKSALLLVAALSFALLAIYSVNALTIDSVSIADEIVPGETSRITIGLENNGDEDLEDVSVVLILNDVPFAPFNSASEFGIDEIDEDKRKFANFEIIALNNAKAGIYKIPLEISYKEVGEDDTITKESLISIVVNSKPELDVSIEENLLLKGKENDLSIKITNKGLSDAKFVEIEIGSGSFNLLSPRSQYIGDVDSDDFDSVDAKIFFNANAPNNVNFPVTVIYRDDLNKIYRESFNPSLKVYSQDRAVELGLLTRSQTPTYVVGVLFVLILYFIYRRLKKRAKNKRNRSNI